MFGDIDEVVEYINEEQLSPWGNDDIILEPEVIIGLLVGKKYYYFDGEYGHRIYINPNYILKRRD